MKPELAPGAPNTDPRFAAPRGIFPVVAGWLACCVPVAPAAADAVEDGSKRGAPVFTLEAAYTADLWRNTRGGLREGNAYLDNLDLALSVDGQRAWGVDGLTGYAHVLYNNGTTFSDRYVSNIDTRSEMRLYEAWVEWASGGDESLAFRFGLYDLNSEFDTSNSRSQFIHSTHGVGHELAQSGENGPSIFPNTSMGLRVAWDAGIEWRLLVAVLDGVPGDREDPTRAGVHLSREEGALTIMETQWSRGPIEKLSIGHWRYTARFDDLLATEASPLPERQDNHGTYGAIDIALNDPDAERRAWGFLRYGVAEERINEFDRFLGIGLRFAGLVPGRPGDQLGIAFSGAHVGGAAHTAATASGLLRDAYEAAIEVTWRAELSEWLTLQPDIQYVINPGADPELDDALAIGLRIEIAM